MTATTKYTPTPPMSRSFNEELQTSGALYERPKFGSHSRTADGRGRTGLCDFPATAFSSTLVNEVLTVKSTIHLEPQLSTKSTRASSTWISDWATLQIYKRNVRMQFDWLSRLEILVLLERQSSSLNINKERSCDQPWIAITLILPLATAMHKRNCFFLWSSRVRGCNWENSETVIEMDQFFYKPWSVGTYCHPPCSFFNVQYEDTRAAAEAYFSL